MAPYKRFPTPEAAALAGWADTPQAAARVLTVTIRGDRAEVVLDTSASYRDWVYCQRRTDGWEEVTSGNGPSVGWDDAEPSRWSL